MAKGKPARQKAVLRYPSHWFKPEDLLTFVELTPFSRRWRQLEQEDICLQALQIALMATPKAGSVIEGTGGLRKFRFSPPNWDVGKSGALRVCYAYFEEVATIVLAIVYQKGEKNTLTSQDKTLLRGLIDGIGQKLLNRPYRCGTTPQVEEK